MFGRWSAQADKDREGHALAEAVRAALPEADEESRRVVTAIVGLLGGVAYADRAYLEPEAAVLRAELGRIRGMTTSAVDAVLRVLERDIVEIATVQSPRYCRALVELADRDLRVQVLNLLVDVAAADETISHDEVTLLRNTTTALGLLQADYNAAQDRHRDKLASRR